MAQKKKDDSSPMLWLLALGGAGIGVYMLIRNAQAKEPNQPAALPPVATPATYSDLTSVANRVNQLRELFVMGTIPPSSVLAELQQIASSVNTLTSSGRASSETASEVLSRVSELRMDVLEYLALAEAAPVS